MTTAAPPEDRDHQNPDRVIDRMAALIYERTSRFSKDIPWGHLTDLAKQIFRDTARDCIAMLRQQS